MAETHQQILTERRDDVLLVTLNRPEKLNAWTPRMMGELVGAITDANDDPAVGAIVVTGAGRGFCAGADVEAVFSAGAGGTPDREPSTGDRAQADATGWVTLCRASKPLLAAVNGPAVGVGVTMVLPFDQILAADGAKLSIRFVKMGLVPELASTHFLVTRCGFGAASWLALSGATIAADEAARLRLVDHVCPPEQLVDRAVAMAHELAASPPAAVRMIKELLTTNGAETDLDVVQSRELAALTKAYASPEHHAAVRAFLDTRSPNPSRSTTS